jgi:hypothetical protein
MNTIATTVKNLLLTLPQSLAARRPLSLMAAAALPISSFVFVHHAAESFLPGQLVAASLGIMVAIEWLQWTALDRMAQLDRAREDDRVQLVKALALGIGLMQVAAYTLTLILFAAEAGMVWGSGWALAGCIAASAMFAVLNFCGKHAYADQPAARQPRRDAFRFEESMGSGGAGLPLPEAHARGLAVLTPPRSQTEEDLAAIAARKAAHTTKVQEGRRRNSPRQHASEKAA